MYRLLLIIAVLATACGDNQAAPRDAGTPPPDVAVAVLGACLDRPSDLSRTPSGQLPCELLPPGFKAPEAVP